MRKLLEGFVFIVLFGCTSPGLPVPISFSGTDAPPPADAILQDGPCGREVIVAASSMPLDEPWAGYEFVQEIALTGELIRSWSAPPSYYPVGTEDAWLLMNFGSYPEWTLMVAPDGALRLKMPAIEPDLYHLDCPESLKLAICMVNPSNRKRLFVYQPPCT